MKKLMISLMVLAMVSVPMFATYTNPESKTVNVHTTIDAVATMNVVKADDSAITEIGLSDGADYGDEFYVKTSSNVANGFKLTYTMSALKGATGNSQIIPVTVETTTDTASAVEKSFLTSTRESQQVLSTTSSEGTEAHKVTVRVKANSASWKTDVKADTYAADLTFTYAAN